MVSPRVSLADLPKYVAALVPLLKRAPPFIGKDWAAYVSVLIVSVYFRIQIIVNTNIVIIIYDL